MSSVSLPVSRPAGRALVVGSLACRSQPSDVLQRLGFGCTEADHPYAAMAELCRRPLAYQAVILSLQSIFFEELQIIPTIKRRYPHVEIWLADVDGRQAALADGLRLGADGLIGEDGLHRLGMTTTASAAAPPSPVSPPAAATPSPPPVRPVAVAPPADDEEDDEAEYDEDVVDDEEHNADDHDEYEHGQPPPAAPAAAAAPSRRGLPRLAAEFDDDDDGVMGEAVLTADELRALLHEQPSTPPYSAEP